MKLKELLHQKRPDILKIWFDRIMNTYPTDTSTFMKTNKDQFANPVGNTISEEIEVLYDGLLGRAEPERFAISLDRIVRIRAVQDFSASQAVGFIYLLKEAIREVLDNKAHERELLSFDSEIDRLAMHGFDAYVDCLKRLYEIRVNETKNKVHMLLKRANMTA
jgi:hypothetical protein